MKSSYIYLTRGVNRDEESKVRILLVLSSWFLVLGYQIPTHAWSSYTHRLIAHESLKDVAQEWGLEKPVTRTPFAQFLSKFSRVMPQVQTRDDFVRWLKINPSAGFDDPDRLEINKKQLTPLEILSLYAPQADDGRDLHIPYDKNEQFWFGSGTKIGSQAFRHMEKRAFDPLHPLNTFGFPLGNIGQASQRAQIYFDLALLAHQLGEPYWAWNFLGVGLHYIQDLGQPYHTAQLIPPLALRGIQAYFQWGRSQKIGLIPTVTRLVTNVHHYFEGYVDHLLAKENSSGNHWIKALHGRQTYNNISSIFALAKTVRDHSNRFAFDAVQATFQITGESLLSSRIYQIGGDQKQHAENPLPYLTPQPSDRIEGGAQISRIVAASFTAQGKAIRTVVQTFLQKIKEEADDV